MNGSLRQSFFVVLSKSQSQNSKMFLFPLPLLTSDFVRPQIFVLVAFVIVTFNFRALLHLSNVYPGHTNGGLGFAMPGNITGARYLDNPASVPPKAAHPSRVPANTSKPNLFIHIGPSKTATTTLQSYFSKEAKEALIADDYLYMGYENINPKNYSFIYYSLRAERDDEICKCLKPWAKAVKSQLGNTTMITYDALKRQYDSLKPIPCWKKVRNELDRLLETNKSILLSHEAYSYGWRAWMYEAPDKGRFYLQLFSLELHARWNVTLVAGYRRYAEWVLSAWKEDNAKILLWKKRARWPHQGGKPLRAAWPVVQRWVESNQVSDILNYQFPDQSLPVWGSAGFTLHVINLHDLGVGQDIITNFACTVLQGSAPYTCQHARSRDTEKRENVLEVDSSAYNMIVFEAAKQGLFNKKHTGLSNRTRSQAASSLRRYHQNDLGLPWTDLPLKCPSRKKLEWLLNVSLDKERAVVPDFFHEQEAEHCASFWKLANGKKSFCSVDMAALFRNKSTWQQLLDSLNQTR
jgi:hypothetical protein